MSARRRGAWRVGLALLALLAALLLWLLLRDTEAEPSRRVTGPRWQAPEVLRPDAATSAAPAPGELTIEFDAAGHLRLALDAGVGVRLEGRPAPRQHLGVALCEEPLPEAMAPPDGYASAGSPVAVAYADGSLTRLAAQELAVEVAAMLEEAAALLNATPRSELLVVVYADGDAMHEAVGAPPWSSGAYDGAVHVAVDRIGPSLRHEVMHAQMHATAPCVPYWLDEGLATYFERLERGRAFTWLRMLHRRVFIPLSSMAEPLAEDEGAEQMEQDEVSLLYAQALAMSTMLVEDGGEGGLVDALRLSNEGAERALLWDLVMPGVDGARLLEYLARRLFPDASPEDRQRLRGHGYFCFEQPPSLRCRLRPAQR